MLQFGTKITQANDPLKKVPVERVFQGIVRPKKELQNQIERLRTIRVIDQKKYGQLKKELPYFVCGHFFPGFRKKENFSSIQYFMVDLDHFSQEGLNKTEIAQKLRSDQSVHMLFISPGGDGLKVMFKLSEPCQDPGKYSFFYRAFIQKFAAQYHLESVIDSSTKDVSRACFFSYDPDGYFNPNAELVVLTNYFDVSNPGAQREVQEKEIEIFPQKNTSDKQRPSAPDQTVIDEIKKKINPNFNPKKMPNYFVPPKLHEIMPNVKDALLAEGLQMIKDEPIQYGKCVRVRKGSFWAELNIYLGKKGFSVVKTSKSGSNDVLAEYTFQLLHEILRREQTYL